MSSEKHLEQVAERIARRERVDWEHETQASGGAEELRVLSALSQIDALAQFHHAQNESSTPSWGPLQLLERIGKGGFGEVWRAWDPKLNRQVALKLLLPEHANQGATMLDEARLLARVDSPQVVRIHGAETHDGRPGIWMEFVEGQDLASYALERKRLAADEVAQIGAQLCRALASVHDAGIIHQDVKLQNVMRRPDGSLVLMDLGAGRRRRLEVAESGDSISFTPRYLAPELLSGGTPSPQSDLWAVGVILYRLASGSFPFDGKLSEILDAIPRGQRQPLAAVAPGLPQRLITTIERALAQESSARWTDARAMQESLQSGRARVRPIWWLAAAALLLVVALSFVPRGGAEFSVQARWSAVDQVETPLSAGAAIDPSQALRLRIRVSKPAWLYVLNRDESGSTVLLYPSHDQSQRAQLPGGRELTLPQAQDGSELAWTLGNQAGLESFLVIASAEPLAEFEQQLAQIAAVDLGQGIVVKPLEQYAMNSLTRGVTGARPVDPSTRTRAAEDLFAMAQRLADEPEGQEQIRMELFVLRNRGSN